MAHEIDIAAVGALLADPGRAAMLAELMGGHPLAAGELARRAALTPSSASNHLRQLRAGGLVAATADGRNRFYRLANAEVAHALEALGRVAPSLEPRGLKAAQRNEAIAQARTCYDHLAGRLGVELTRSLVARRHLRNAENGLTVGPSGARWFADKLQNDVKPLRPAQAAARAANATGRRLRRGCAGSSFSGPVRPLARSARCTTWATWSASRPSSCSIWPRQENPSAITSVDSGVESSLGSNVCSATFTDTS